MSNIRDYSSLYEKKKAISLSIKGCKDNQSIKRTKPTATRIIQYDKIDMKELIRTGKDRSDSIFSSKFKIK